MFNSINFVREELKKHPGISSPPHGSVEGFFSRIGYALYLALVEKEIFIFALLQWVSVGLAYLLWVQMLDWIPEDVWRSAVEAEGASIVDVILLIWSFFCVGLAAFPVGILTGCMGATHFLHKQGRESTIATCFKFVLPQSWPLWSFHWIDGWITVNQILERLPKKNDNRTASQRAMSEALYYAWKLGIAGILPSIVTGHGLIKSGKNSVLFVKDNFIEVARLRAGYSAMCWIVGIGAYVMTIVMFARTDIISPNEEIYGHIYTFYLWAAVPIIVALSFIMLILRPIYVLALCDLYSDHLDRKGLPADLPENASTPISALVAFCLLGISIGTVYLYRYEIGIMDALATPYTQTIKKDSPEEKARERQQATDQAIKAQQDKSGLPAFTE